MQGHQCSWVLYTDLYSWNITKCSKQCQYHSCSCVFALFQSCCKTPCKFPQSIFRGRWRVQMVAAISSCGSCLGEMENLASREICFLSLRTQCCWIVIFCMCNRLGKGLGKFLMLLKLQYCDFRSWFIAPRTGLQAIAVLAGRKTTHKAPSMMPRSTWKNSGGTRKTFCYQQAFMTREQL